MENALGAQYWKLWASSGLSNLADGVVKVALPLVAVQFTRSPVLVAGLAFAVTVPWLLFALPAGALADRLDRRRAMIGANVVRTVALGVLALAVLTGFGSIWALYAVALCIGTAETIYDTSAQSIIPQMVAREGLSRANSKLYAVELTANEFVGPPLAGFLVAAGAAFAFGAPVALWALAVAALLLVRGTYRVQREHRTTLRADIAEGLKFLVHHRVLRTMAAMVGMSNFATNAAFSVFVLHAVGPASALGLSEQSFGLLMTGVAAGSLVGSFVAERIEKLLGRSRALALSVLTTAGVVGVPGLTTNPFVIAAVFFVGGIGLMTWNVITVSLRQRITPDRLLGRVNSGYRLLAWGSMPLGAVAGGLIAQLLGVNAVFLAVAPLVLLQLLGMRVLTDANLAAAER
ncbi:MFS transporter [Allokutzneria sp. NRRL B-24872]|uniref:MFS transporter n=1 Tax=Allokutzneria sp. NRRL B-24872 TaxID=1137961 RepID=UPI000A3C9B84|nr:MFS transporter [Allokutzneria sp. NRRL B-24872]